MENHCTMVYFSLRESKKNKKGLSPIEVSISYNGECISILVQVSWLSLLNGISRSC